MRRWNKIVLKTPNIISDEMNTTDGSPYCSESMIKDVLSSMPISIEDGRGLFTIDKNIISFENGVLTKNNGEELIELDNLADAGDELSNGMFKSSSITSFVGDLPSLKNAMAMFCGSDIQRFVSYTPKLSNADYMFNGCSNLTEFCGDLSSIKNGQYMFYDCQNLILDNINLSSLENGEMMFYGCELTLQSVQNIVNTLINDNTYSGASTTPTITLGVDSTYKQDVINYLIQIGCATGEDEPHALSTILRTSVGQNWTLEINWN